MNPIAFITKWLDATTMYRVVLYVLFSYVLAAFVLSYTPYLYYSPSALVLSLGVLTFVGVGVHYCCAWLWKAPANIESTLITVLILFCILDPVSTPFDLAVLAAASAVAVLSKYVLALRNLHIINPVVFAALLAGWSGFAYAAWWIANPALLAVTLVGGILITTKIRRWELVASTVLSAFGVFVFVAWWGEVLSWATTWSFFAAWPIIFFATVMVTEPLSTPAGTRRHVVYGALIGAVSSVPFSLGPIYSSPELALLLGNICMYHTTLRARLILTLQSVREVACNTYEYRFTVPHKVDFIAGQYLEWTLPHDNHDRRGIRRYFTIASSPTEEEIIVGVKIPAKQSSRFKQEFSRMKVGDHIYATSLDGDFVLPHKIDRPLVFIAGGIGVTPFRSMVKYLLDTRARADITLFNCNNCERDIPWRELWEQAKEQMGMKVVDVLNDPEGEWVGEEGYITPEIFRRHLADMHAPLYYISGPPAMVDAYRALLLECGVARRQIITDFFPGLA